MTAEIGKILTKDPCKQDLFEGKSHEKLAKVIATRIKNDPKCSIIGIDGGWGSGKSNLVGLIENELNSTKSKKDDSYCFFTYDAWGHQNDLPRRTMLEELTAFLTDKESPIFKGDKWTNRLKDLLTKKREVVSESIPHLNFNIIYITLVIIATPIIQLISENLDTISSKVKYFSLVYGAIILVFLIGLLWQNYKKKKSKGIVNGLFEDFFAIYTGTVKSSKLSEAISEKEPSSQQFKDWMDEVNSDLAKNKKHLVFVIDNMDRLPKLKVQEFWSAIHSFFSEKTYSNITLIVPFDRTHIQNAFHSEDITSCESSDEINHNLSSKTSVIYGDDFINKTFYIVYYVAPPILSSWKNYFKDQWKKAFSGKEEVDEAVIQVFDVLSTQHSPRDIIAFINEFVTIRNYADKAIEDKYVALFIFGRQTISRNPLIEILTPSFLKSLDVLYMNDKEFSKSLSSLYFQLPLENAMDVIYTKQFADELNNGQNDSLKRIKDVNKNQFINILTEAILDVHNVENATEILEDLTLDIPTSSMAVIWDCLYKQDISMVDFHNEYKLYHKYLLKHIVKKKSYLNYLLKSYLNAFSEETDVRKYVEGIDSLSEVSPELVSEYFAHYTFKEVTAKQFVEIVKIKKEEYNKYGLTCANQTLSDYLSSLDTSEIANLNLLTYIDREHYPLQSFKSTIEERLNESSLDSPNAEILFGVLKDFVPECGILINYKDYFSDDKLCTLYKNATPTFKGDLIAMRISRFTSFNPSNNNFGTTLTNPTDDLIRSVAEVCDHYFYYGNLLLNLLSFNNPFVKNLAKYLTVNDFPFQSLSIEEVSTHFNDIVSNSDITPVELFNRLNSCKNHKEEITLGVIDQLPIEYFKAATETSCELSEYILKLLWERLESISQEQWIEYIQMVDNFFVQLYELYHPKVLKLFFDATSVLLKEYVRNDQAVIFGTDILDKIIDIANDTKYDLPYFFDSIYSLLKKNSLSIDQILYFAPYLLKFLSLGGDSESMERIFPSEITWNSQILKLLTDNKDIVKLMYENSSKKDDFTAKLKALQKTDTNKNSDFLTLCQALGIEDEDEKENNDNNENK